MKVNFVLILNNRLAANSKLLIFASKIANILKLETAVALCASKKLFGSWK